MFLVNEYGDKAEIKNELLPKNMTQWCYTDVKMIDDDTHLEKYWVAMVNVYGLENRAWELAGEKTYDHYPSENELLWLLAQYDAFGPKDYVTVDECYRVRDYD